MKNSRYWTRDEHEEFAKAWIEAAKMPEKDKAVAVCLIGQKFKREGIRVHTSQPLWIFGIRPEKSGAQDQRMHVLPSD